MKGLSMLRCRWFRKIIKRLTKTQFIEVCSERRLREWWVKWHVNFSHIDSRMTETDEVLSWWSHFDYKILNTELTEYWVTEYWIDWILSDWILNQLNTEWLNYWIDWMYLLRLLFLEFQIVKITETGTKKRDSKYVDEIFWN